MNHDLDYPPQYLADILENVRTVAMVGASNDPAKASHGVLRAMIEAGYDMIPVNPHRAGSEIFGLAVHESLRAIGRRVDMVNVFRPSAEAFLVTQEAIAIGARVVWMQIGVRDDEAARLAEDAGLRVVMDRCLRTEWRRWSSKPRMNQSV